MFRVLAVLGLTLAGSFFLNSALAVAQEITTSSPATVSSVGGGDHWYYEIHIEPDDANKLIVCGTKLDAEDDAPHGFVYYSPDGGKTWTQTLQDKNSTWVTEQSCAYGVHGIAYFVSSASKVIDGLAHHDLGTTRIYVSRDSGNTWSVGIKTGWTDASTSVVDTAPGPNQNRLYVLFNDAIPYYHSLGQIDKATAMAAIPVTAMISYKAGDTQVRGPITGPFTSSGIPGEKLKDGTLFPAPSVLLRDGSILAFYNRMFSSTNGTLEYGFETVRSDGNHSVLEAPVKIIDSHVLDDQNCSRSTAGAYDPVRDKLYFLYPDLRDKSCHLFVTTSSDGGRSWSKAQPMMSPDETPASAYSSPTVAVNREGVLGVMWEEKRRSGCWMFAISEDVGVSLSKAKRFGTCGGEHNEVNTLSDADLWTTIFQAGVIGGPADAARIAVHNMKNHIERIEDGIAVTPDGVFHPVWMDAASGHSEVRTVAIHVTSANALIASETKDLLDVTSTVAVLYGGKQHYDAQSGIVTVDVVIQNKSSDPIRGPMRLVIPHFFESYGHSEIANAENKIAGAGAVWDISSTIPGGKLDPGAKTRPFPLKFHYLRSMNKELPLREDILDLTMKVFARSHTLLEHDQ